MKKRVHRLIMPASIHCKLLGISSHENDYRLSWALNGKLGMNFRKTENHRIQSGKNEEMLEFSIFQSFSDDNLLKFNLISNRGPDSFLIPELKNIDFFLQVFGEISQAHLDKIATKLKTIDIVSTVFEVPPEKLKKPLNLPPE